MFIGLRAMFLRIEFRVSCRAHTDARNPKVPPLSITLLAPSRVHLSDPVSDGENGVCPLVDSVPSSAQFLRSILTQEQNPPKWFESDFLA